MNLIGKSNILVIHTSPSGNHMLDGTEHLIEADLSDSMAFLTLNEAKSRVGAK